MDGRRWKAIAFGVSAGTVGAAGALNTVLTGFVSPDSFTVFLRWPRTWRTTCGPMARQRW